MNRLRRIRTAATTAARGAAAPGASKADAGGVVAPAPDAGGGAIWASDTRALPAARKTQSDAHDGAAARLRRLSVRAVFFPLVRRRKPISPQRNTKMVAQKSRATRDDFKARTPILME